MRRLLVIFIFCLPVITAIAQDDDDTRWKNTFEIRAGVGAASSYEWAEDGYCWGCEYYYSPEINLDENRPTSHKYSTGAWWVGASVSLSRFWDVGATMNYEGFWQNFDNGLQTSHYLGMQAMGRVNYINTDIVRLYSSLSFGGHAVIGDIRKIEDEYDDYHDFVFDCHLTAIGVSVGKRFFGFTEVGVGPRGILTGGVGYRF